jgi:hypothetical protein
MVTFAPFFQKQQPFVHSAAFLFLSMKQKIKTLSATNPKRIDFLKMLYININRVFEIDYENIFKIFYSFITQEEKSFISHVS